MTTTSDIEPLAAPFEPAGFQFAFPFFAMMCSMLLLLLLSNVIAFNPLIEAPVSGLFVACPCSLTVESILSVQVDTSFVPDTLVILFASAPSTQRVIPGNSLALKVRGAKLTVPVPKLAIFAINLALVPVAF